MKTGPVDEQLEAIAREATACFLEDKGYPSSADAIRTRKGAMSATADAHAIHALARSVAYQAKAVFLEELLANPPKLVVPPDHHVIR